MATTLYHFSGTGNSLKVARDLAETLGDTALVPLARASGAQLAPTTDTVGVVFPVYAWGPPTAVTEFLDRVDLGAADYVFAVCTCAGSAGGTLAQVRKQLHSRGIPLSSGFVVYMPTNYIVWAGAMPEEKQQEMFTRADARVSEMCDIVREKKVQKIEGGGLLARLLLSGLIHRMAARSFVKADEKFTVGPTCKSCGTCAKVCPVANIRIDEGRPAWLHHCQQCLACLQWCPQQAINVGRKTEGRTRYHHPDISAADLM